MSRPFVLCLLTVLGLTGCSTYVREERPAWRAQAENACLAQGLVRESASLRSAEEISGPGICGLTHPFRVTALSDGTVAINSTQTLDCPMIATLETWLKEVVQPAALARFGEKVVRINSMGSYSCRGINNVSGAHLSEHAFGNAIDIGGFVLESGRELNIMRGFNGSDPQESAFLHEAHAGACSYFTTVLGPGYNIFHYNHFHFDLAMHGSTLRGPRRYCKPVPQSGLPEPPRKDNLPDPPAIEEEMDIARAPLPEPSVGSPQFVASVPAVLPSGGSPVLRPGGFAPVSTPPRRPRTEPDTAVVRAEPQPGRVHPAALAPLISFSSPGSDDGAAAGRPSSASAPRPIRRAPPVQPTQAPSDAAPDAADAPAADPVSAADPDPAGGGDTAPEPPTGRATNQPFGAEPTPRPRAPVPIEGRPADWDLTSSIR